MCLKQTIIDNLSNELPELVSEKKERFASDIASEIFHDCNINFIPETNILTKEDAIKVVVWLRDNYANRLVKYFKDALLNKYSTMNFNERDSLDVFKRHMNSLNNEDDRNATKSAILVFRNIGNTLVDKYCIDKEVTLEILKKSGT